MKDDVNMREVFELAKGLTCINRYSQSHLSRPESVMEHTGFVCMVSYAIAIRLTEAGDHINFGELLSRAVAHDIDEVITGDIPKTTKYANPEIHERIRSLEDANMLTISKKTFGSDHPYYHWRYAKDESKEGLILRMVDCFAVVFKAWHESNELGNRSIVPFVRNVWGDLQNIRQQAHLFDKPLVVEDIICEVESVCVEVLGEFIRN